MKGIDSLIRLHKWRLDEERRRLLELENMVLDFDRRLEVLDAELAHEAEVATRSLDAGVGFGGYAAAVRDRRERLVQSRAEIEAEVNANVLVNHEVRIRQMPLDEAKSLGAMALFGEKYADIVRTVGME